LPLIVSKVVRDGASRDDERVVADLPTAREHYLMAGDIDIDHFAEAHLGVLLAFQQDAQRGGDVGRGKAAGGDLVEQRLEKMEVPPVDQSHLDRGPFQGTSCEEAAKAASYNDNAVLPIHTVPLYVCPCSALPLLRPVCRVLPVACPMSAMGAPTGTRPASRP
jgi:hypothetical protein